MTDYISVPADSLPSLKGLPVLPVEVGDGSPDPTDTRFGQVYMSKALKAGSEQQPHFKPLWFFHISATTLANPRQKQFLQTGAQTKATADAD